MNVVPRPGSLSTRMSPPCRLTIEYAIESPSPEPASPLVEKNGSKMRRRISSDMPTPVSLTVRATVSPGPFVVAIESSPPVGIASTAFRTRFVSISVSAAGRPLIGATASRPSDTLIGWFSRTDRSSRRGFVMATASSAICRRSTSMNGSSGRRRANC